ncbi:MAG: PIN domain-containing protein [Treponema sp.]|jgi:predicted nucleic acid-binding protein|nr:PIN domain-containing protein [Treponema sp.]
MSKPRFILDSNVIIDALNNKLDLEAALEALPEGEVYVNLVVEIEVLAKPGMDEHEETKARTLLSCFLWADVDTPRVREEAIRIRRVNPKVILLPDALIAATAISLNATVLSNDPHLRDFQWPHYVAQSI